jgi:hypothetical protein
MASSADLMGFSLPPFVAGELANNVVSLTAAGTTAGTAILITEKFALVTAATSATGVILPSSAKFGTPYYIVGVGSAAPVVYPPTGGSINAGAANAGLTLSAATATAILMRSSTNQWYSFPLAP